MAVPPRVFPPRKRRPSAGAFLPPKFSDQRLLQSLFLLSQEISSLNPLQFLLKQMYLVLQRIKTLLEDCVNGSKMWLLMQSESVANNFHELTAELATLLDILPVKEVEVSEDVDELFLLLRKQCSQAKVFVDERDSSLRLEKEIVPDHSKLAEILDFLGLPNSLSCKEEIENLEDEVQNQQDEKAKSDVIALIGLVRYAKCVLFEPLTPGSDSKTKKSASDVNIPADFRCPISLDLMRDPVVVATGQTAQHVPEDRSGPGPHQLDTQSCFEESDSHVVCRELKIPFETAEGNDRVNGVIKNKAALEATKMTASFLVSKMAASQSMEEVNGVIYELRTLAKSNSDSRACIAEAGAIPVLARYLGSDVNAVTAMLNLSILEANKTKIMENGSALNGVIEVLRTGATWEAKGNAAATIFSLSCVHSHRKRLGRKTRPRSGPAGPKRDALVAILNLAGDREAVRRLVEEGVVDVVKEVINVLPVEAAAILEMVVRRGGITAKDRRQPGKSAAATLVTICRKGGAEMVVELASIIGIERIIWELMESGTVRARRKASSLLRIVRRWAAGLDGGFLEGRSAVATPSSSSSRVSFDGTSLQGDMRRLENVLDLPFGIFPMSTQEMAFKVEERVSKVKGPCQKHVIDPSENLQMLTFLYKIERRGFCEKIQLCNMGGFHKINGAAILMLLLVMVMSQPSHARLLRGSHPCNFDATQEGPDLALSGGKDVSEGEEAVSKYRPLLLNLLPKGPLPPSGPSKRTNNVGN
uniref:RING-type E3 ubiquitin transferase n=2 Tax=Salix viminalis TaxID=40686 RepID=A0A6N2K7M1_SALVM